MGQVYLRFVNVVADVESPELLGLDSLCQMPDSPR